jgi:Sulfotransferase family
MMIHRPDFIVIGAMKSATTTLHEQLARQPGFFMSRPKEPNFFSDDEFYSRGRSWYSAIFEKARPDDLRGESSTHYAKLPTHPNTVERMTRHLPRLKLLYLMRHPIDRLMSQYVHEVTAGRINVPMRQAVDQHPELVEYSRYAMQLQPFLDAYGFDAVLPVFFPRLIHDSQLELERIGRFLGHRQPLFWDVSLGPQNVGRERLRPSHVRQALVQAPLLSLVRRRIVPRRWSQSLKGIWKAQIEPPTLTPELVARLREVFDADLAQLGAWLGVALDCDNFHEVTRSRAYDWCSDLGAVTVTARIAGRRPLRDDPSPKDQASATGGDCRQV